MMDTTPANENFEEFPFEEIRQESGDYFDSIDQAKAAGYPLEQIWSICDHDGCWTAGPPHHWVNLLGYIATKEVHDHNTYYFENIPDNYGEPSEAGEWHSFDPDC